jgi:hypothetical protein
LDWNNRSDGAIVLEEHNPIGLSLSHIVDQPQTLRFEGCDTDGGFS